MTTDVIVVGAGPTGLTAACELASRGLTVEIVDRADGPFPGSRGKGVQPRTLELLDRLGVADRLVSLGRFALPICRWAEDPDGEPVGTHHELHEKQHATPDSPYGRVLIVPQWRTEQVLREHLATLGPAVRWGTKIIGVDQDGDGVTVHVEGAASLRARWVIGCDGGTSAVRHALGIGFLGETHDDIRMLLGDVVVEGADRDRWHMWEPFLGLCPLPATDTFALQAGGVDRPDPLDAAAFQDVLDRAGAGHIRVREVRWSSRWRLNVRMVDRYRSGRVLLAGDAAHVHSPAGAQGLNTGIGDAVNLGWKLAAVCAGADESLLDTYEAERLPVAAEVLGLSTKLTTRRFEDRGADGVRALQLGLSYREGPLAAGPDGTPRGRDDAAHDDRAPDDAGTAELPGPRSGDRAPDAPLRDADGRRVRLFDVFRHPGWTLLGFGTAPGPVNRVRTAAVFPADAPSDRSPRHAGPEHAGPEHSGPGDTATEVRGLWDRAGHAARAYAPAPGELVLVRPDGYVGLRTTDPAAVRTYLAALGPVPATAVG